MVTEHNAKGASAEQFGQGLVDFVHGTEFGTPQYQAVNDFIELRVLQKKLGRENSNIVEAADTVTRVTWASHARITELQIALLGHEISHSESRVQGYANAYTRISVGFEDLITAAYAEAEDKFTDEQSQDSTAYVHKIHSETFTKAQDAAYRKRQIAESSE